GVRGAQGAPRASRASCASRARRSGAPGRACSSPAKGSRWPSRLTEAPSQEKERRVTERTIASWLTDMDRVLVHEGHAIPGAPEFVRALRDKGRPFRILTNNSIFTARDLRARLATSGID